MDTQKIITEARAMERAQILYAISYVLGKGAAADVQEYLDDTTSWEYTPTL